MTQSKPGVVNLNQQLTLKNFNTTEFFDELIDTENLKFFTPVSCYFNFKEDRIEFILDIHKDDQNDVKIQKPTVHFKLLTLDPVSLPITLNDQKIVNNCYRLNIHANFKDCFLHSFKAGAKEFHLKISYTDSHHHLRSKTLYASLPDLPKSISPSRKLLGNYNVEDLFNGIKLKKLFEQNFATYSGITNEEQALLKLLKSYQNATIVDQFSYKFDFLIMFQYMVAIEDMESIKEIRKYALDSAQFYRYKKCPTDLKLIIKQRLGNKLKNIDYSNKFCVVKAEYKLNEDVMEFYSVYIYNKSDYKKYQNDSLKLYSIRTEAKIEKIFDDIIIVTIFKESKQPSLMDIENSCYIEFVPNRMSIRIIQRALADMYDMKSFLQNFETKNILYRSSTETFDEFDWFTSSIRTNEEQMLSVKNIVNCTSFPSPFIIFGGPGTGKSTTIVEAIAQIVKLKPDCHVLFTAGSNSTCDDIGNRLAKYISVNKILRIHAKGFDQKNDKIRKFISDNSNFHSLGNSNPSYKELMTARVVIVTIISVGQFFNGGYTIVNHFDYIFIDEAGFVSEPEIYVPLSCLGMCRIGVYAQIVLAGDHKQLRPIIKNSFIEQMGLETSLMERLMDNDQKYKRSTNGYDNNYVVQLKQNYRNHPAIMHFSNENFYDSQLVSMQIDRMEHPLIINKEFPVIFYGSTSPSMMVGTSLKNEGELDILKLYVNDLLKNGTGKNRVEQSDIGIISPYSAQRNSMNQIFRKKYPKIEIGTVDSFQGREKKIIIISCVRSKTSHVGFLSNEKRLNVALTRAKSLLIVIGNAATLQNSNIWHKFILYCYQNKATKGDLKDFDRSKTVDKNNSFQCSKKLRLM